MARVNVGGIPCIESSNITVGDSLLVSFNPVYSFNSRFSGLIAIKINNTFTAPESAVPVEFVVTGVSGSTIGLTKIGGTSVTSDELVQGIYLVFYDRSSNTMQLVSTL